MSAGHIIILLQTTPNAESRTYLDFNAIGKACQAIIGMFEERLKALTPGTKSLTYDIQDVFRFIDNLNDIAGLKRVPGSTSYEPIDKEGLKVALYNHLRSQAQ